VHLFSFIIRIYHNARSSERQICRKAVGYFCKIVVLLTTTEIINTKNIFQTWIHNSKYRGLWYKLSQPKATNVCCIFRNYCVCIYIYIYIYIYICVCVCVCMYIYIYVCVYIYIYIYIITKTFLALNVTYIVLVRTVVLLYFSRLPNLGVCYCVLWNWYNTSKIQNTALTVRVQINIIT